MDGRPPSIMEFLGGGSRAPPLNVGQQSHGSPSPMIDPALSAPSPSTSLDRQLNVTDALTYLDTVKTQFANQPDVYNQFLDIMKDFKSQAIDTPGVINRVSLLFHGNPPLIAGFNTFLPAGYRIDISADQPNTIKVTSPSGTVIHPTGPSPTTRLLGGSIPMAPLFPPLSTGTPNPHPLEAGSSLGQLAANLPPEPVEPPPGQDMTPAIDFLSRVRERFTHRDPDVYKRFVELIQAIPKGEYQPETIQAHGQKMLRDDPDLMQEFLVFLPGHPSFMQHHEALNKSIAAHPKRRKRVAEKDNVSSTGARTSPTKKPKHQHRAEPASPSSFSPRLSAHEATMAHHLPPSQPLTQEALTRLSQQTAHSPYPPAVYATGIAPQHGSPDPKLRFFDHARRRLVDPSVYQDFLKLLSLFSEGIIDMAALVERASVFLDDDGLLTEFKTVLDWDESKGGTRDIPPGSIRTRPPEALNVAYFDEGQGPSYRRLPKSEVGLACSARDQLCRSVLNDEWVSHPTWASEEAGFMTHKKNAFEEALHKSEEERHEYHVYLQGLTATIGVLETVFQRFEEMDQDDLQLYRLEADFGGPSKGLYHRTLKKVYGRDAANEVILALQESPAVTVPIVLGRLKAKDADWRRALREWSSMWREVDSKNFYKSLDHQGITFKVNDKKAITSKQFVQQIQVLRKEQLKSIASSSVKPSFVRGNPGYQLEYRFDDIDVLHDSLKLVYSFLDHSHAQYSLGERQSVESFLQSFMPLFFGQPAVEFNTACGIDALEAAKKAEADAQEEQWELHSMLMKIMRKRSKAKNKEPRGSTAASRAQTPDDEEADDMDGVVEDPLGRAMDVWVDLNTPADESDTSIMALQPLRPFFANTTFYTLLRLLQSLYTRLLECKQLGLELANEKHASLMPNPIAAFLGLDDPNGGPATLLTQAQEAIRKARPLGASPDTEVNVVYTYFIDACEKWFNNELDPATFEEHMRWFFGNSAYQLFTLDKLVIALIKQVQSVIGDNRSLDIWRMFEAAAASPLIGMQDLIRYRREAELHVGADDHLYRIQWNKETRTLQLQLLGDADPTVVSNNNDVERISRWRQYSTTYAMQHPTEWMPTGRKDPQAVFLRRTLRPKQEELTISDNHTCVQFMLPGYKMLYQAGSEEVFMRQVSPEELERARSRDLERRRCGLLSV